MKLFKSAAMLIWLAYVLPGFQAVAEAQQSSQQPAQGAETGPNVTDAIKAGVFDTRAQTKAAIRDLARRQDVALNEVKTVRVEDITWPDGSLGCPQKDMSYTQAEVPGVLIVLSVSGSEYEYHAGDGNMPAYCAHPLLPNNPVK